MATARAILERGDGVLIFPEGTRTRPGALGAPRRGVGRLALETGAPVIPVAVIGTEAVRRGWRIRPRKVRIRAGRAAELPARGPPVAALAARSPTASGPASSCSGSGWAARRALRRAAVVGAGAWGTGLAVALARAGVEVELGTRTAEQRDRSRDAHERPLPARRRAAGRRPRHRAAALDLPTPTSSASPSRPRAARRRRRASARRIPARAGVVVLAKGLVPPLGDAADRVPGAHRRAPSPPGRPRPRGRRPRPRRGPRRRLRRPGPASRQLADLLAGAGFAVETTTDVAGVELAGAAKNAAVLAAATAAVMGPNAAGAAAGNVFAEVDAYARRPAASRDLRRPGRRR